MSAECLSGAWLMTLNSSAGLSSSVTFACVEFMHLTMGDVPR